MAGTTLIEWTDTTWNPVTGCIKIGAGCDNCYAERFAERWRGIPGHAYEQGFDLRLWPDRLDQPLRWTKPRMVFVNSMSDLFLKDIPPAFLDQIFDVMEGADRHVYQILTKRSSRMQRYLSARYQGAPIPDHIWPGVSVEDAAHCGRIDHLKHINSAARFISFEPLLAPVGNIDLTGIAWAITAFPGVIDRRLAEFAFEAKPRDSEGSLRRTRKCFIGGESGPRARVMRRKWAIEIRDLCERDRVAFFFKQWGGARPKSGGRLLEGREWNEMPSFGALQGSGCPGPQARRSEASTLLTIAQPEHSQDRNSRTQALIHHQPRQEPIGKDTS